MKFAATFTGYVPHHIQEPTYQGSPSDYRLKLKVTEDVDALLDELTTAYEKSCEWYREQGGGKNFFDAPFTTEEDGSLLVKVCAKPKYQEFPFPVVDGQLEPLEESIMLREGTMVLIQVKPKFISPKASKGGMRLVPQGMQVLKAVTGEGADSGGFDLSTAFKKRKGFKQSKPAVEEPATVADEDEDF
tara:strand:- start:5 stop:568 length:564 start_codon:yes stop_codon:yes gene_type:complete